jgi:fibronectin-binding autotransporter adhesin
MVTMKNLCRQCCVVSGLALVWTCLSAHAATHTWTGTGANAFWSTASNWTGGAPAPGEAEPVILDFPPGAARLKNTNNLAGLTIHGLTITGSGYTLQGQGAGTNITFASNAAADFFVTANNNALGATLNLTLSGTPVFAISGSLNIAAKLTGTGGFVKTGAGPLNLSGVQSNTFTGTTTVTGGSLNLAGGYLLLSKWVPSVMIAGPLIIGNSNMTITPNVLLIYGDQIADTSAVTINPNGYLYLGGNQETIGTLTMIGGSLYGDSLETSKRGTLTLGGNLTAPYSPLINGAISANLNLGGITRVVDVQGGRFNISGIIDDGGTIRGTAGITKIGAGTLRLGAPTNTYNGVTLVSAGTIEVASSGALGLTSQGTTIAGGATLLISATTLAAEPITLIGGSATPALSGLGDSSVAGPITFTGDCVIAVTNAADDLRLSGLLGGAGGFRKTGEGTLWLQGTVNNTYTGDTAVSGGALKLLCGTWFGVLPNLTFIPATAIPGHLQLGPAEVQALVQLRANNQLSPNTTLTFDDWGQLDLNGQSAVCRGVHFQGGWGGGAFSSVSGGVLSLTGDVTTAPNCQGAFECALALGSGSRHVTVATNSVLNVAGVVKDGSGAGNLIKDGPGVIALTRTNTYTGSTEVIAGSAYAYNYGSFGTGPVTVDAGGQIVLYGIIPDWSQMNMVLANQLTLHGDGPNNDGALIGYGTNTWAGPIILGSDSLITTSGTNDLLTLGGAITGPSALNIAGRGRLVLGGADENNFAGPLSITGTNQLLLNKTSGATAVPGSLSVGQSSGAYESTRVALLAPNQIANNASVHVLLSGVLDLQGFSESVGPLTVSGGTVDGTGTLTLNGNVTNDHHLACGIYCPVSLGGQNRAFYAVPGTIELVGPVKDGGAAAGIIKYGTGLMQLDASNSFSGLTLVNEGYLDVVNDHALGSVAAGTVVADHAGISLGKARVLGESLTLGSNAVSSVSFDFWGDCSWTGPIEIRTATHIGSNTNTDELTLAGVISGSANLVLEGLGSLRISGANANSYSGVATVRKGTLLLAKVPGSIALGGSLVVGVDEDTTDQPLVQWDQSSQLPPFTPLRVTLWRWGRIDLNGHSESFGSLVFNGGTIQTGTGTLTLQGDVFCADNSWANFFGSGISGRISLDGQNRTFTTESPLAISAVIIDGNGIGGIIKEGHGALYLSGHNTYQGTTLVRAGLLQSSAPDGLGSTAGATVVSPGATLFFNEAGRVAEPISLSGNGSQDLGALFASGTNLLVGPLTIAGDATIAQWDAKDHLVLSNAITGSNGLHLNGGTFIMTGTNANTLTGTLVVSSALSIPSTLELNKPPGTIAVAGPLIVGNDTNINQDAVRWINDDQLSDVAPVIVANTGLLDFHSHRETVGDLNGSGRISLGSGILITGGTHATNHYQGIISGVGGQLAKTRANTFILSGPNTYSGNTRVQAGTLVVNGPQPSSDIYLDPGTTLAGNVTIGKLYSHGGTVSPGSGGPGRLSVTGNATLDSASKLLLELSGTSAGTLYDQLSVSGELTPNQATLTVVMNFGGTVSNQYAIVNHPSGLTASLFAGLANGGQFTANNGAQFRIDYNVGGSHDTLLTQLTSVAAPKLGQITRLSNGNFQITSSGQPGQTYSLLANEDLRTTLWALIGSAKADSLGTIIFSDSHATNFTQRFYLIQPQ